MRNNCSHGLPVYDKFGPTCVICIRGTSEFMGLDDGAPPSNLNFATKDKNGLFIPLWAWTVEGPDE